jgi:hypothetical protein
MHDADQLLRSVQQVIPGIVRSGSIPQMAMHRPSSAESSAANVGTLISYFRILPRRVVLPPANSQMAVK